MEKVVLAYSGGLDTSIILKWLREERGMDVIAYVADLGQGKELDGIRRKALRTGASKVYVEDLREEFVRDYVFAALKANAIYEGTYLLGTSIARPLIAKRQVEIARREKAAAVAHSKKVVSPRSLAASSASAACSTASSTGASRASSTGWPSMQMRSLKQSRWGEV